jgi:hypothetical protein
MNLNSDPKWTKSAASHHHNHHLHGLGFLKACSGFTIFYKSCLKFVPMNILKLFSPSSAWTPLVSSASGFVVQ